MESFCWRIQALAGQTLYTTRDHAPFEITEVTAQTVYLRIGPDRKRASIIRDQFAEAERKGLFGAGVIPRQLDRAGVARGRTAYAASIIRAVVE